MHQRIAFLLLTCMALAACAPHHPLGIADDHWQALSNEQRLQAYGEQAAIDRAENERQAAEARASEAEALRKNAELAERRRVARDGERVQCVLGDAEASIGNRWRKIEPVALDLVLGLRVPLTLIEPADRSIRRRMAANATFDGQIVSLCPGDSADDDPGNCVRMLGTYGDYRRGIDQRIDSSHFLRGRLRCEWPYRSGALHDRRH
ncbi:hypothetical protein [Candidatus Symbiobacter mobilis]|uniref:Lipoprotein n=1 Tax=Candidatus Symbiobacter mobilis CR TaxID=946483 RepID=U5N8U3_9BURK|nr:hypothetical protein [Candidatus Symbiobacter mobilis]AGX87740.1 hypothetical protein Cenrod_1655 [Candidatus Symbiobacter mobilis CR]